MRWITKGATSQTVYVEILDSTSTTGGRKTGLAFDTASLVAYYVRNGGSATAITLATLAAADSAWSSGGFKEVSSTNMPGVYRLDLPDAAVASGADSVLVTLKGATGMVQVSLLVPLIAANLQDSVRAGLTALPNAAAEASGGLPTLSAAQASNGTINANVHRWLTGTPNALQSGRVDGYIGAVASGVIAAASFASGALDAVWSTTTRLLTAGTNIALAKGVGVTGFNDLSAADLRTAVGLASANLDTQLSGLASDHDAQDTAIAGVQSDTDNIQTRIPAALVSGRMDASVGEYQSGLTPLQPTVAGRTLDVTATGEAGVDLDNTAGTLAKGTDLTGFNDLDAAGVRTAVGLASANLDTQLDALPTNAELATALAAADDAVLAAIAALNNLSAADIRTAIGLASANLDTQLDALPTAAENADAVHDEVIDGVRTLRQLTRGFAAALLGKASGMEDFAPVFRNIADSKDVITATTDADGNRTAVTLDLT